MPAPRVWYAGLDERLMELAKEDPEVYKHWHDWYEPKSIQPLWLKPNSTESLEKLMEVLDTAIKERRWTHEPIRREPTILGPHALYEETAFVIAAPGNPKQTLCWMHTFLHQKDVVGMRLLMYY